MQKVITAVRSTLTDLKLAIDGTIIMSENLRDALDNMFDARIPNAWKKVASSFLEINPCVCKTSTVWGGGVNVWGCASC